MLDPIGRHILLERLDCRVMAAGLLTDRELCMASRRRNIDGPVTRATHIGFAALLDALKSAASVALCMMFAVRRPDQLAELVFEPLSRKISLLMGNPFLQPEMRFD